MAFKLQCATKVPFRIARLLGAHHGRAGTFAAFAIRSLGACIADRLDNRLFDVLPVAVFGCVEFTFAVGNPIRRYRAIACINLLSKQGGVGKGGRRMRGEVGECMTGQVIVMSHSDES